MNKPFQREGSISNAHVGREFEKRIQHYFAKRGQNLKSGIAVKIGINGFKSHNFDLGNEEKKVLVECKAHKWTKGGNIPSAKLTVWNEAMFLFHAAPSDYKKILFILKDFNQRRKVILGEYYIKTNSHLIPKNVELWEFDDKRNSAIRIYPIKG